MEWLALIMFAAVFLVLLAGYSVALSLAGVSLLFAFGGILFGVFNASDLGFIPNRLFGIITNQTMIAVPLFVFMGVVLEKTRIAERLLANLSALFGSLRGGLGFSVIAVGALMAASTGIVGATVVTMGLMSLPTMLERGYDKRFATGVISATGTLGQLIPPSIALVLLGDVLANAYQQAQLGQGIFAPDTISVGDLFAGALLPGLLLVAIYSLYTAGMALFRGDRVPAAQASQRPAVGELIKGLAPPLLLIIAVLGSILGGLATPTEAAGVGASGALLLALIGRKLDLQTLRAICESTLKTTAMVFFILIGASIFSLVFRGYGGDDMVHEFFMSLPGGMWTALALVMLVVFLLGFMLDFIEIIFVVVPIVGPVLLAMGIDPIWLGVLLAANLQTSFLTPPFGFALFYLRGVTPPDVSTMDIYRGVLPFVFMQLLLITVLIAFPPLATWLPELIQ